MMYYGLLLFFLLEYVRIGNYVPGVNALHLNALLPLGVFLGTLFANRPVSNRDVLNEPNTRLLCGLLGLIVLTPTMPGVEIFTTVLGYTLVFYVIFRQATDLRRIKGVFKALIFVHLTLIALTPEMLTSPDTRHYVASGTFLGDGNDFALSVVMTIPLGLFVFSESRSGLSRLAAGAALILLVLAVVATQSRGGTLALGAVAAYYWWKSPKKILTGLGAVVAVIVVLAFAPPQYFQRMNSIAEYETDGSAQGRITAWKAGTGMMLSNPILGVGAGQFAANYPRFAPGEFRWKTAHSIYFLILGELGIPGILLLLAIIFRNIGANRRLARELRAQGRPPTSTSLRLLSCLSASMIAYAVAGAFLSATYYPHMFVFAGLMSAGRRLARSEQSAAEVIARPALESRAAVPAFSRPALPAQPPLRRRPRLLPEHGRFF